MSLYAPKNPEEKLPAAAPPALNITRIPSAKVWISDFTNFAIEQVKKISSPVTYNAVKIPMTDNREILKISSLSSDIRYKQNPTPRINVKHIKPIKYAVLDWTFTSMIMGKNIDNRNAKPKHIMLYTCMLYFSSACISRGK